MSSLLATGPPVALLALGAVLLLWGADQFMARVASVARLAGVPVVAVGLLAVGAEPEELTTALVASASGRPYLAAGVALGANVAMVALGLGLAVLAAGGVVVDARLRRYGLAAAACGLAAAAALADGRVDRWEGSALGLGHVALATWVWREGRRFAASERSTGPDPRAPEGEAEVGAPRSGRVRTVTGFALGLLALVVGSALAVDGAAQLAAASGLGERVTGLLALGLATSIEVLALARAARSRGLAAVVVAGVLGSVAFNATLTLGAAALVTPLAVPGLLPPALLAALLPLCVLVTYRGRLVRGVGLVLVATYTVFVAAVLGGVGGPG